MANKVEKGDTIKVDYVGKLKDGTVFDTSMKEEAEKAKIYNDKRPYEPLQFEVGAGQMIKGFDEAVVGMAEGETKEISLKPEEAYGQVREELVKDVPKKIFENKLELKEGLRIVMQTPQGPLMAKVVKVGDENVTLNLNHELAGKDLEFTVTIKEVTKA